MSPTTIIAIAVPSSSCWPRAAVRLGRAATRVAEGVLSSDTPAATAAPCVVQDGARSAARGRAGPVLARRSRPPRQGGRAPGGLGAARRRAIASPACSSSPAIRVVRPRPVRLRGGRPGLLWPSGACGFGSKTRRQDRRHQAAIADNDGFAYYPLGRCVTEFPEDALDKRGRVLAAELSGMERVIALYQKCPHLGAGSPNAPPRSVSSSAATARSTTASARRRRPCPRAALTALP